MTNASVTPLTLALSKGRIFEETMPLLAEAGIDAAAIAEAVRVLVASAQISS